MFGSNYSCGQCGEKLFVSSAYSRFMIVISLIVGFIVPWITGLSHHFISILGSLFGILTALAIAFPIALLIVLPLMIRFIPLILPPKLVPWQDVYITSLNIRKYH